MKRKKFYLVFLFFITWPSLILFSQNSNISTLSPLFVLSDSIFPLLEKNENYIDTFYAYFADTSETLTIEEVSAPEFSSKFIQVPVDTTGKMIDSLIKRSKVFWLRISIKNSSENIGEWWFDCHGSSQTTMFFPGRNGFSVRKTGFRVPLSGRDVKLGEEYLMNVFVKPDTAITIYFRREFLKISKLSAVKLANKPAILEDDRSSRYLQGAFFGLLLIIALYNLLLYFFVKEKSNIHYALYLLSVNFSYLAGSGYGFELFWPNYPGNFVSIIPMGWASAGFFYVQFGRSYLQTKNYLPKWNRILKIHITGSVIASIFISATLILLNYFGYIESNNISIDSESTAAGIFAALGIALIVVWIFFAFFIVLIPAYYCYKKGYQPARYFLYASIALASGILIQMFSGQGNIFSDNAFQFGMGLQAVFFSLGLGYRINLLQEEKQFAQKNALIELEEKVKERTFEVVKQKEILEDKQKEIIDSITYAKRLQEAILPPVEIIKKFFPESFVLYLPKDIVAGDFYWMETVPLNPSEGGNTHTKDGRNEQFQLPHSVSKGATIFIAAADCTGHGVPGAMVSVVCSNSLNRAVREFGLRDTGKILDKVTDLVLETFSAYDNSSEVKSAGISSEVKDGMDISLLRIEFPPSSVSGEEKEISVQWSGANNPLWYVQNGELKEIKADKQPVGKFDIRKPFTTHNLNVVAASNQMGHSDTLAKSPNGEGVVFYLFTDGFPDQFGGPKKKKFMYRRMEENIRLIQKSPMDEQERILLNIFNDWKGNLEQLDDVTVIGIRI